MEEIELKKAGRDDEALVKFYIAIGKKLDAPALYQEASILLRKYGMHDEEIRVLKAGIANVPKGNSKHWEDLNARLEKAESLASTIQRIKDDDTERHSRAHAASDTGTTLYPVLHSKPSWR